MEAAKFQKPSFGLGAAVKHCSYYPCNSIRIRNNKDIINFHRFPRNLKLCKIWCTNCGRLDLFEKYGPAKLYSSGNFLLCSRHFESDQFATSKMYRLKLDAIPTVFEEADSPIHGSILLEGSTFEIALDVLVKDDSICNKQDSSAQCNLENITSNQIDMNESNNQSMEANFTNYGEKMKIEEIYIKEELLEQDLEESKLSFQSSLIDVNMVDMVKLEDEDCINEEKFKLTHDVSLSGMQQVPSIKEELIESGVSDSFPEFQPLSVPEAPILTATIEKKNNTQPEFNLRIATEPRCSLCGIKFIRISKKLFSCGNSSNCASGGAYTSEQNILNSVYRSKFYKCTKCDYVYIDSHSLNGQVLSIPEKLKLKPFRCLKCDYACSFVPSLSIHFKSVHTNFKPFACLECDYACNCKQRLIRHMKSVHEKLKPYKCSRCESSFSQKRDLGKHLDAVHEKLKPYKCFDCGAVFSQNGGLCRHVKSVHEKLRPYKCSKCNFAYSTKENLTKHFSIKHEKGETP